MQKGEARLAGSRNENTAPPRKTKGCTDQVHFDQRFTYASSVCNDSIVKIIGKHGVLRRRGREAPFGRHRGARWLRHSSLRGAYHAASSFLASAPLAASDLRGLNQSIPRMEFWKVSKTGPSAWSANIADRSRDAGVQTASRSVSRSWAQHMTPASLHYAESACAVRVCTARRAFRKGFRYKNLQCSGPEGRAKRRLMRTIGSMFRYFTHSIRRYARQANSCGTIRSPEQ